MNKRLHTIQFILADWFAAAMAWGLFFIYRKIYIESVSITPHILLEDKKFMWGILVIPICWIAAYTLVGSYQNIYRRSRLHELGQTIYISIIGVLIIFFMLLLDDSIVT